ncbi:MAG: hypothetical protein MI724_16050 [Spirochaetales bacterium]|nr:hypothetical protein [Spirochaetales bacterium]
MPAPRDTEAHTAWRPPLDFASEVPPTERRERMLAYYDAGDPIDISTRPRVALGAFDVVARDYIETLLGEIVEKRTAGGSDEAARHALTIALDGEYLPTPANHYGRAILIVTYRTGPGMTTASEDSIVGPYRLSRLSRVDSLLNSLRDISPHTMRRVVRTLQERAADEMGRDGLSYTVHWETDQPLPHDLRAVLRIFGHPAGSENTVDGGRRWNFFEPPNALAERMETILHGSSYRFVLEPLTGTIRFFYNSST